MNNPFSFIHRKNSDGTWDSMCITCFETLKNPLRLASERLLCAIEVAHICKETKLSRRAANQRGLPIH